MAVERVLDRRLVGRPVIVAAQEAARAAVYDMSEEAFQAGVRKNMPLGRAQRQCRDARVLGPRPDRYGQAMVRMCNAAVACSPIVEPGDGDGHLFVDVTGSSRLLGPPVDVAWRLSQRIRQDLGLSPIWSVATSKLIAKTATRLVKPLGEYIVEPGDEAAFLAPLPLFLVPGIEQAELARLREFNVTRVSQATALTDGVRRPRQVKAQPAVDDDTALFAHARRVLDLAWTRRTRIRRMTLTLGRLTRPPAQQLLFTSERSQAIRRESLMAAMDKIRDRFGNTALKVGRTIFMERKRATVK